MSSYFGALLRATGLGIDAAVPAISQAGTGLVEIDIDRGSFVAAPALPSVEPQSPLPAMAVAEATPARALSSATPVDDRVDRDDPRQAADRAGSGGHERQVAGTAAGPAAVATDPPTADSPAPALRQQMVQAAMQWVAADPLQSTRIAGAAQPPAQSTVADAAPARRDAPRPTNRDARVDVDFDCDFDDSRQLAAQGPAADAEPDGAPQTMQLPSQTAVPQRAAAIVRTASFEPPPRGDLVEVSIGEIHLRVDAPAAQTVARSSPSPPAAAPRAPAIAPRSALSRRALRRI